ncbi:hypothetical protein JQK87_29340 [Streptomyces sp. G44]|uniref:hypothetical protein n=1 Tax=Streptomyces sp. G44 TaxID=2807632 RepID=UPI00195F4B68|nr:hypothetical protein [Streptomyces sp. G44]MBM7172426.1 hypothetical protein [Streptomyces sp. G44]
MAACYAGPIRYATKPAAAALWRTGPPLGAHPALARLALHRYDEARAHDGLPTAGHRRLTAV